MASRFDLASILNENPHFSLSRQISFVWTLSVPGILAQISSILMQYIDAAMVGKLGAEAAASIGLVASSTWLFWGLTHACSMGFTVQVAHAVGAGNYQKARSVLKQALLICFLFSIFLGSLGALISGILPFWLGGSSSIASDASRYFLVCCLALPLSMTGYLCGGMLQCSGNMKIPGILNVVTCLLDVVFNFIFIFLLNMGVLGAALGTASSMLVTGALMVYFCCFASPVLGRQLQKTKEERSLFDSETLKKAARIAVPMGFEQFALCGAQVLSTKIVAPLGTVAIAANSFGITAESLCYMPGYGIQEASTTLVGQSMGARRKDLARRFAFLTIAAGMAVMAIMAVIMYFSSPALMAFLTPDRAVQELGVKVLRIEMWAEPLFAASIVATGVLRGAGDTLMPGIMNLVSMWGVRLTLAAILTPKLGLSGAWIAMAVELCFRGIIFLIRVIRGRWLSKV